MWTWKPRVTAACSTSPTLVSFSVGSGYALGGNSLTAEDGGQIDSGTLTTLERRGRHPQRHGQHFPGQISDIDDSSVIVEAGANLSLPGDELSRGGFTTLEATGAGERAGPPNLTSISDTSYSDTIEALDGGTVKLNSLASLTANVDLEAQGSGSVLNIPEPGQLQRRRAIRPRREQPHGRGWRPDRLGRPDDTQRRERDPQRHGQHFPGSNQRTSTIPASSSKAGRSSHCRGDELPRVWLRDARSHRGRERAGPRQPDQRHGHVLQRYDRGTRRRDGEPDQPGEPDRQCEPGGPG